MKTRKPSKFLRRSLHSPLVVALSILPVAGVVSSLPAWSQATQTSGSIQGTVTDASGAVVPGAKVTITGEGTAVTRTLTSDSAGFYNSGPLVPGTYKIAVVAAGFSQLQTTAVVQISTISTTNPKLTVGSASQVVEVQGAAIAVNTEQSNVQTVLTPDQIRNLPVQGRNFLDLAQLEPGVQLQSGQTFDPTKAGYSALSISGVSGRTTRILLDGSDITDETVGTTIFNVPSGAIGEFELNRSTADVSGEISSSGSVFVQTPSGTNAFHGQGFYQFQNNNAGFASAGGGINPPFERNQFGGNVGGPILKDKLFFFGDLERIKQDSQQPITLSQSFAPLQAANPTYGSPFRDTYSTVRLDYDGPKGIHFFARANYEVNSVAATFGYGYSLYANRDNTPGIAGGADFVTGKFTHSFRISYEKFHNLISDETAGNSGLYNPVPSISLHIPGSGLYTGPNLLAPQQTYQSDKQVRYDGSWTKGPHTVRFGGSLNRILGGGFASFYGLAPFVSTGTSPIAGGDPTNPLDYSASSVTLGNGQGYDTEIPAFGAPAGGQGDWRFGLYVADTWKVTPTFTLNYGLRYSRDTGRSDSDLAPLPCSTINTTFFPTPPCSGTSQLLDLFGPGLGDRIHQPNNNYGPQVGFAYAPGPLNGKTVIRAGIGLYYENFVFNNVLFDRPFKLQQGLFFGTAQICGGTNSFTLPDGTTVDNYNGTPISTLCSEPVGTAGPAFAALEKQYQAAVLAAGAQANANYIGNTLAIPAAFGYDAYAPQTFTAPRSVQINFGVQQQVGHGMVLTADYLHQVTTRFMQAIDVNHVGDARFFNSAAAATAVANTVTACGVGNIDAAIASCPGLHSDGSGATIIDLSGNGLDSGVAINSGLPNQGVYANPNFPNGYAFPGQNPNVGQGEFQYPSGRSAYDALQIQFKGQKASPFPGIAAGNIEVSYNFSRFVTTAAGVNGSDQFFTATPWDQNNPTRYIGPGNLDATHQVSFGGYATIVHGPRIGLIGHFYSTPPVNLTLDNTAGEQGNIFTVNTNGDGLIGTVPTNLVPGTNPGSYNRQYSSRSLNKLINAYNARYANTLTPQGQDVVNAGILTSAEMVALGAAQQPLAPAPADALHSNGLTEVDANVAYPIHLRFLGESTNLEPSVAVYNVGNNANYNNPVGVLLNTADAGAPGYANSPSSFLDKQQYRVERGPGTFNLGGPRTMEFILKLNF